MIRLLEKMVVRQGPLYHAGELYAGPHETWAVRQGIGVKVEEGTLLGPEETTKNLSRPPSNKMVKRTSQKKHQDQTVASPQRKGS